MPSTKSGHHQLSLQVHKVNLPADLYQAVGAKELFFWFLSFLSLEKLFLSAIFVDFQRKFLLAFFISFFN